MSLFKYVFYTLPFFLFIPAAHASKTVTSTSVTQGETFIEWKGEYTNDDDGKDGAWKQKAGMGHAFTSWWGTEIEGNVEQGGASPATIRP